MKKIFSFSFAGSFTIEAAFILPIVLILIGTIIVISFNAHNVLVDKADEIFVIIDQAPNVPEDIETELIDISKLNGRKVLLQYKLLKDGFMELKGGLKDE